MLITSLVAIGVILFLAAVVFLSDNLIQIEAQKAGLDTRKNNYSIFPKLSEMFGNKAPAGVDKSKYHKLSKGHNIKLTGTATDVVSEKNITRFSVRPQNFRGNAPIPKMLVTEGQEVKAGEALFFDKAKEDIKYVAPVSGEVVEIRRGTKRSIIDVIILADKKQKLKELEAFDLEKGSREELVNYLKTNGAWSFFNQRPFDIVADSSVTPRDIFISGFNTAPLAADVAICLEGRHADFQKGLNILNKLTDGKVYLSLRSDENCTVLTNAMGVEKHYFSGPHPAGNVGVQIHNIKPIKAMDVVWTVDPQDVATLGKMFNDRVFDPVNVVALTGGALSEPHYIRTKKGANIGDLLNGQNVEENSRIIAGDVLTGVKSETDGFLNKTDNQLSVIKEGNEYEMFGWLLPIKPRPSVSRTFPGFLMPNHQFEANTNTHGEHRAFVATGLFERLLPMDIYLQHLMKAILAGDIEKMEGLGITELTEEDVALAEFSSVSKQPLQKILREGLDLIREQG